MNKLIIRALALTILPFSFAVQGEPAPAAGTATAVFAGGCFWCLEPPFDALDGVLETTSGYSGGHVENPEYKAVSAGTTGHKEVIRIIYDPSRVSYEELLTIFWKNIDPTDDKGQFCDKGEQYQSAIFAQNERQRQAAEASLAELRKTKPFPEPIVTPVLEAAPFYAAEDYHQDYYQANPLRYKFYRRMCGRDQRLEDLWGQPR